MIRILKQPNLSGPVGISAMAGTIAQSGFAPLLLAVFLSINLGVILIFTITCIRW